MSAEDTRAEVRPHSPPYEGEASVSEESADSSSPSVMDVSEVYAARRWREKQEEIRNMPKPSETSGLVAILELILWVLVLVATSIFLWNMWVVSYGSPGQLALRLSGGLVPREQAGLMAASVVPAMLAAWLMWWFEGRGDCSRPNFVVFPFWFVREYIIGWYRVRCIRCLPLQFWVRRTRGRFFGGDYRCPLCEARHFLILVAHRGFWQRSWIRLTSARYLRIHRASQMVNDHDSGRAYEEDGFQIEDGFGQYIFVPWGRMLELFSREGPFGSEEMAHEFLSTGNGWTGVLFRYMQVYRDRDHFRMELAEKKGEICDLEKRISQMREERQVTEEILKEEHRDSLSIIWDKFRSCQRWPRGEAAREMIISTLARLDPLVPDDDHERATLDRDLLKVAERLNQSTRDRIRCREEKRRQQEETQDASPLNKIDGEFDGDLKP